MTFDKAAGAFLLSYYIETKACSHNAVSAKCGRIDSSNENICKRIIKGSVTLRGQSHTGVSGAQGSKTLVSDDQGSESFSDHSRLSVSDTQE